MKRLKSFAGFVAEAATTPSVTNDEIITSGADVALAGKKETVDAGLARLGDEKAAADKKEADEAAAKAAAPAASASKYKLVKGGTDEVAQWQDKLVKAGFKIDIDGAWGKNTQKAYVDYLTKKHGADNPMVKKAAAGTAPAVAKGATVGGMMNFFKTKEVKTPVVTDTSSDTQYIGI